MKKELSWPAIFLYIGIMVFLLILWFFVNKSTTVKKSIVTANAIAFNRSYAGAVIHTSVGDIGLEFLQKDAPKAIYNFINLANKNFYDGTKFHYILKNLLVQGGDPLSRKDDARAYGTGGPGYILPNEFSNEPVERGAVAMANLGTDTSGSQFFIITAERVKALDGKFTVFAKVINGFDVLDKINSVPADHNVPIYPIEVRSVDIE